VSVLGDDVTAASMTHSASGYRRVNRSSRTRSASHTYRVRFLRAWAVPVYSVAELNRRSTSLRGIMIRPYWVMALKVPLWRCR